MAPVQRSSSVASLLLFLTLSLGVLGASSSFAFRITCIPLGVKPKATITRGTQNNHHRLSTSQVPIRRSIAPSRGSSIHRQTSSRTITTTTTLDMGATSSTDTGDLDPASSFRHKSILLTGASRGLGKALALRLTRCNPSLLILSGRDEKALEEVQRECLRIANTNEQRSDGSNENGDEASAAQPPMRVEIVACDLGDKSSVERLADESLRLARPCGAENDNSRCSGVIDVLINNGGISSRSSFLETDLDVDERLMQVNFFSGAALAKRAVPGMVERGGGRVIWISSVQGKLGTPYRTSYAASKFAVQGYCEALRSELAPSNVSVHVVSPGYIRTNLSVSAVMGDGKAYSKMDETTANGADPGEVAEQILDLVTAGRTDFVVAATFSAKAAMWLKFLAPSFLEGMLVKRFEKQRIESKKN